MNPKTLESPFLARQSRLHSKLAEVDLELVLVTHMPNVHYLTGFRGSAGVAAFGGNEGILFVDPRYTLQAGEQASGVEVQETRKRLLEAVGGWLKQRQAKEVGCDDGNLSYAAWSALQGYAGKRCRLRPTSGLVEDLRLAKDATELGLMRQAGKLTSEVFNQVRRMAQPGVAESDLAAEIEYRLKQLGAEGVAFETIVASGPRSAFPHARASSKLLKKSEFVIFDLGAIISGYAADMTRTLYLGTPDVRARRIYSAVLDAEKAGISTAKQGTQAAHVDEAVRRSLAKRHLVEYFTHSTGHGVGLEIHERPRVAKGEKQRLGPGFVVTVEPGVYLEGYGGVRIEDTVAITDGGPEVLTTSPKDDWIIA